MSEYVDKYDIKGKWRAKSHYETYDCKCCKTGAFRKAENGKDGCKISSLNLSIRVRRDKTKTKGGNEYGYFGNE